MRLRGNTVSALAVAALTLVVLGGCGRQKSDDLVNGKALFVQKCGSCHTLSRAGTQGRTGPNLDDAFAQDRRDGFGAGTIRGVVRDQIANPNKAGIMPANLVTGQNRNDVAAYVGEVAAKAGQDTGALATAGLAEATSGRQIFTAAGCGGCHALAKAGSSGTIGPPLNDLTSAAAKYGGQRHESPIQYVHESIVTPDAFIVPGFKAGTMPANFGQRLKPKQIDALVAFLLGKGG